MSFYDSNQTGQLMSRVTNDVSQVQFFLTQGIARLVNTSRDGRDLPGRAGRARPCS
jgi:ABC-type multidrug transport system fused ATPase/permease subunit